MTYKTVTKSSIQSDDDLGERLEIYEENDYVVIVQYDKNDEQLGSVELNNETLPLVVEALSNINDSKQSALRDNL